MRIWESRLTSGKEKREKQFKGEKTPINAKELHKKKYDWLN